MANGVRAPRTMPRTQPTYIIFSAPTQTQAARKFKSCRPDQHAVVSANFCDHSHRVFRQNTSCYTACRSIPLGGKPPGSPVFCSLRSQNRRPPGSALPHAQTRGAPACAGRLRAARLLARIGSRRSPSARQSADRIRLTGLRPLPARNFVPNSAEQSHLLMGSRRRH